MGTAIVVVGLLVGLAIGGALAVRAAPPIIRGPGGSYGFLVADGPICQFFPELCPANATASSGDVVHIQGSGSFDVRTRMGTGSGTFVHNAPDGSVVGQGTWTVTRLVSFQLYGTPEGFPIPGGTAGKALLMVTLTPDGTTLSLPAMLRVTCVLPGVHVPGGAEEGIRLSVNDMINFNREAGGGTLFIKQ